jgi:hypothetical protein
MPKTLHPGGIDAVIRGHGRVTREPFAVTSQGW